MSQQLFGKKDTLSQCLFTESFAKPTNVNAVNQTKPTAMHARNPTANVSHIPNVRAAKLPYAASAQFRSSDVKMQAMTGTASDYAQLQSFN